MKTFKTKFKLIFLPFLLIAIGFILLYSLLNWALFIQSNFLSLKEDIPTFWLPFGLACVPVLLWLRPRIKLLHFKNDNGSFACQLIAVLAIAAPTIVAQMYLDTATGKLTKLDNIAQYRQAEKTKYYSLNTYFIDKSNAGVFSTAVVSGKNNENLTYSIYIALPIFANAADTAKDECSYWLGKRYLQRIKNNLGKEEKNAIFKTFARESQNEFDTTDFQKFVYLDRIGNTEEHDKFNTAIKKSKLVRYQDPVVFTSVNEPFENRNGKKFGWIFKSLGIGALVFLGLLCCIPLKDPNITKFSKEKETGTSDVKELFNFLIPQKDFFATAIIIDINILVYLAMVFCGLGVVSFQAIDLLHWGGNYGPYTTNGQWWRLVTNIFLHGGLMHIFANMAGLLFVGVFLEPLLGRARYFTIYLATGIIASCTSIWWHAAIVSVGASGAIFGLYGFFLALLLFKVYAQQLNKAFLASTLLFIGYNLVVGLTGGIDNAAHIGGLVSGFLIGLAMAPALKRKVIADEEAYTDENTYSDQ